MADNYPLYDQMKDLRDFYGISASDMCVVCGFSQGTWRKYERGNNPHRSHELLIRMILKPSSFLYLLDQMSVFDQEALDADYSRLVSEVSMQVSEIQRQINNHRVFLEQNWIYRLANKTLEEE